MNSQQFFDLHRDDTRLIRPFIIAEAGVNHEGSLDRAKQLIREAKEGGADAIKFQTYKAEKLASRNSPAYWDTTKEPINSQFALFEKYDKFWQTEFELLKDYCDECEIEFMSTPFDLESAHFLNDLMAVFKISSSDITNKPFIDTICGYGKPLILSTGASNLEEIREAVSWVGQHGNPLSLLHCVLNYPTENHHANLGMIMDLKTQFPDLPIGYSDHTVPGESLVALEIATTLGASVLEKHFTHDKTLPGNDHYHAMDKADLARFSHNLDSIFELLGEFRKTALDSEQAARDNARRSLVSSRFIPSGKRIDMNDLTFKRPASGISPKQIDEVIGNTASRDIEADEVIQWALLSNEN